MRLILQVYDILQLLDCDLQLCQPNFLNPNLIDIWQQGFHLRSIASIADHFANLHISLDLLICYAACLFTVNDKSSVPSISDNDIV